MYIFAATGGRAEPIYKTFASFDELAQTNEYNNIRELIEPGTGERVDIFRVEDNELIVVESHTGETAH